MRRNGVMRRWLGWMALVAVWLTVLAPTVSRGIAWASFPDLGAWCQPSPAPMHAGMSHGGMAHAAMSHATMVHRGMSDHDACDTDAACGYCTLFAQQPALGGAVFVGHPALATVEVPIALPALRAGSARPALHAPSQGPPFIAHA